MEYRAAAPAQAPEEAAMFMAQLIRTPLVLLLVLFAFTARAAWPVTVVDDLGRTVTLQQAPQRLVSLLPSHTETVCALSACERLVGRDTWSDAPMQVRALPDLGSAFTPDLERLVALQPDLVLVDEYSGAATAIEALGIPVYAGSPQRLAELFALIETFGLLLGVPDEAARLHEELSEVLLQVAQAVAGRERPRVFYEIDPSPYSVGPNGLLGELLSLAGGDNIVPSDLGDFPLVDPEFVVAQDPEVIVLADAPYGVDTAQVAARPGWANLRAIRNGRVIELTQEQTDLLSRAGPRLGEALRLLVRILHPGVM